MDGGDEGCVGSLVNVVRLGEVDRTGLWGGRRGASEHDGVLEDSTTKSAEFVNAASSVWTFYKIMHDSDDNLLALTSTIPHDPKMRRDPIRILSGLLLSL